MATDYTQCLRCKQPMEVDLTTSEEGQAESRDATTYVCPTCGITVKVYESE